MHSDAPYPSWVLIWLVLPSGFADGELGTHPEQLRTQRHGMPVGRQGRQLWARDVKLSAQVKNAITCTFTAFDWFLCHFESKGSTDFLAFQMFATALDLCSWGQGSYDTSMVLLQPSNSNMCQPRNLVIQMRRCSPCTRTMCMLVCYRL